MDVHASISRDGGEWTVIVYVDGGAAFDGNGTTIEAALYDALVSTAAYAASR